MKTLKLGAAVAASLTIAAGPAMDWQVDASHTEVSFEVRHFFTPVTGKFEAFEIDLNFDPAAPQSAHVSAVIQIASIDTDNDRRNAHLRTPDFFDAETYPTMTFESASVREVAPNQYVATGDLKIKDVTRRIDLPITLLGVAEVPNQDGSMRNIASFSAELTVDRRDFGVGTGSWAETAVVSSEVKIRILVEASH